MNRIRATGKPSELVESRGMSRSCKSKRTMQVSWMVIGAVLVVWGLRLWGSGSVTPIAPVPSLVLTALGLAGLVVPTVLRREISWRRWEIIALTAVVIGFLIWVSTQILANPSYLTDEMAFDQWAATLWVHGINPYGRSLATAFSVYHVSPDRFTWTLTGKPVTLLSYPALAFEVYAPAIALGWTSHMAVWMNSGAWALGIVLAFIVVPRGIRPWVLVLGSLSVYVGFAEGGVTDALYVPFLVLAAWGWDRYPEKRGWAAVWPAVWMGLAMGIKQTPWIIWPFLVMGFIAEARHLGMDWSSVRRMVARYTAISGGVFFIPNVPFVVMNPGSWIAGVLAPLISRTVPDGQGLITLSIFEPWGGGSLKAYTVLSMAVLLTLLVVYPLTYPRLKAATFLLPSVALFFATRSFASYLLMLLPSALVAVATSRPWRFVPPLSMRATWAVIGGGILCTVLMGIALVWPSPVQLRLVGIHTSGELATVDRVTVEAMNSSNIALKPTFTADIGGSFTAFWNPLNGPKVLAPHHSATYTLAPANFGAMPPVTGGFQIVSFDAQHQTVSRTAVIRPNTWHLAITPAAVDRAVPKGATIHFTLQILNQWDQAVRVSGVPVYLGQVVYAQHGPEAALSVINRGYVSETPVSAVTNNKGQAIFTVRDITPQPDPVYYEGNLVNAQDFYPYGFSPIVPVRYIP